MLCEIVQFLGDALKDQCQWFGEGGAEDNTQLSCFNGHFLRSGTDLIAILILLLFTFVLWTTSLNKPKALSFQIDRDEIWRKCSSRKYAFIGRVGFLIWCNNFKMAAMTSFHVEQCCHLVNAHIASSQHVCSSTCKFLIYRTFVLVR